MPVDCRDADEVVIHEGLHNFAVMELNRSKAQPGNLNPPRQPAASLGIDVPCLSVARGVLYPAYIQASLIGGYLEIRACSLGFGEAMLWRVFLGLPLRLLCETCPDTLYL